MKNLIDKFIEDKKIGIVGVSGKQNNWGKTLYKEFKGKGYNVKAVNPEISEFDGDKCYRNIDELPEETANIIFAVSENIAFEILGKSSFQNRKIIWLLKGASSKRNIQLVKEKNLEVINTLCPLLFIYEKGFHRFHYNILRFFHLFPKGYSKN
jgi:predicted CoA-binding protein